MASWKEDNTFNRFKESENIRNNKWKIDNSPGYPVYKKQYRPDIVDYGNKFLVLGNAGRNGNKPGLFSTLEDAKMYAEDVYTKREHPTWKKSLYNKDLNSHIEYYRIESEGFPYITEIIRTSDKGIDKSYRIQGFAGKFKYLDNVKAYAESHPLYQ